MSPPTPPSPAPAKKKTKAFTWGVVAFAGLLLLGWLGSLTEKGPSSTPTTLEERGRDLYEPRLSAVMQKEEGCEVVRTFYNGWKVNDQQFFWSVECRSGSQFVVSVKGKTGEIQILGCEPAKAIGVTCFEKWQQ